jgi:hypothetical protein
MYVSLPVEALKASVDLCENTHNTMSPTSIGKVIDAFLEAGNISGTFSIVG